MSKRKSVPKEKIWPVQYRASRVTGKTAGGCFWNPPKDCIGRILDYHHERWVLVWTCRDCKLYKNCEVKNASVKLSLEELDTPQNRRKAQRESERKVGRRSSPAKSRVEVLGRVEVRS